MIKEIDIKEKRPKGRPFIGGFQKHLTVWVYPDEWDNLKFKSASSGKTLSKYIEDKVLRYISENGLKEPKEFERSSGGGKVKPLSFSLEGYNQINEVIEKAGFNKSQYLLNIALNYYND